MREGWKRRECGRRRREASKRVRTERRGGWVEFRGVLSARSALLLGDGNRRRATYQSNEEGNRDATRKGESKVRRVSSKQRREGETLEPSR